MPNAKQIGSGPALRTPLPGDEISCEQRADYEFRPVHGGVRIRTVAHVDLQRWRKNNIHSASVKQEMPETRETTSQFIVPLRHVK